MSFNVRPIAAVLAALSLAGAVGSAEAAVVFFTNRAAWQAAAGANSFSEDFSSFAADTSFRSAAVTLNGLSIAQEGSGNVLNEIDVTPLAQASNNGTANASMLTDFGLTTVRLTFGALNAAFGFETWSAASGEVAQLEVFSGTTSLGSQALTNGAGAFLGYVLTAGSTASSVRFSSINDFVSPGGSVSGESFGLDNLAGVNAVPTPGSLELVSLALAAAGLVSTHRRRASAPHRPGASS